MRTYLFVWLLILSFFKGKSQRFDLGSWNIVNLKYTLTDKWNLFGEAQLRSLKFYTHYHYYEYKGGISYKVHKNAALSLGAGSYQTFKEGGNFVRPKNNDEFRLWPQLILSQALGLIRVEQRYRSELRFTSNGYRNRFRYRLGLSYPFGKKDSPDRPFQISASNEVFFTDNEPYFERNRALFAFSYRASKSTLLQVGYLHQFDYKINDESGRDFLQLGYFIELGRKGSANPNTNRGISDSD